MSDYWETDEGKKDLSEMRRYVKSYFPDKGLDESGDSVPDVQVRGDNQEDGQECGGGEGHVEEKARCLNIPIYHPYGAPDMQLAKFGESFDQYTEMNAVIMDGHFDKVEAWARSSVREWPECCGKPREVRMSSAGYAAFVCVEVEEDED